MPEITFGRWSPTEVMERVLDGTWVIPDDADATDAAVMVKPTSIAYTGTSATLTTNGSVEFTAVTNLDLRGVFSSDYDNYTVIIRGNGTIDTALNVRLLLGVTPDSTSNSGVRQLLMSLGTTTSGVRSTSEFIPGGLGALTVSRSGNTATIYGPYLTQPTAGRVINASGTDGASIYDYAWTHNVSSSFDGFRIFPQSGNITGLISVYGIRGA
jgi:hypothetical protein